MLDWRATLTIDGTAFALAPMEMSQTKAATDAERCSCASRGGWSNATRHSEPSFGRQTCSSIYGGSTTLLAMLLQPQRLVAVDLRHARVQVLDEFIAAKELAERVHPYYGSIKPTARVSRRSWRRTSDLDPPTRER